MSRSRRSTLAAVLLSSTVLLGALGVRVPTALGDADPASDTLLVKNVFYPYTPATPAPLRRALGTAVDELHAAGLKLRVAIIASPVDLGGIPQLFGQVRRYAAFLDTELSYRGPQPLLVVMPDGVASEHAGPPRALSAVPVEGRAGSAGLARTAVAAVERIAASSGHPIAPVRVAGGSGAGGSSPIPIALGAVAAVALAGAGTGLARRRRSQPGWEHVGGVRRDRAGELQHDPRVSA